MKKFRHLKIGRYIALLIIMLTAVAYVNGYFYISFKNQAEKVNEYVQEQIINNVAEYYRNINSFVVSSISDDEILQMQNFSNRKDVYESETALSLVRKLRANNTKSTMLSKTYVYISNLNLVLCNSGIIDAETFYSIDAKKYFDSYNDWIQTIQTTNKTENFYFNSKSIMFSFVCTGIGKFKNNENKIIIGAFSDKENIFVSTPHIEWVNQCNIYVYNRNGELNLCEERINVESLPNSPTYADIQNIPSSYDVISYDVAVNDASYNIVVAFKKDLNMQNVKRIQFFSITITIVVFILAFYYFCDLYKKRYRPIIALSTLLNINVDKIDYRLVEKPIRNIIDKNNLLNEILRQKDTDIKLFSLKQLLRGEAGKSFLENSENLGVKFEHDGFFVVAMYLYKDCEISEEETLKMIQVFEDEISALLEAMDGCVYYVLENQYIICICNTSPEINLESFASNLSGIITVIEESFDFIASVGISSMHTRVWHISRAYTEALEMISRNDDIVNRSEVLLYEKIRGKKNKFNFDLKDENKLTEAIKNGNFDIANKIIESTIDEIEPERSFLYMNVVVGLVYSLMRISSTLFGEKFDLREISFLLKNTDDLENIKSVCCEFANKMCEESSTKVIGGSIAKITRDYLEKNYSNTQLTKEYLSEKLGYSFVYVNNSFKNEFGTTVFAYLNNYRIQKAMELLIQDVPVRDVSKAVGILSIRTFYRLFQSTTGMTPAEYKKKFFGKEENRD